MTDVPEFAPFPKIARWSREIVVTEKIDGTNAGVLVGDEGVVLALASRSRWLTDGVDNHGFANWASKNMVKLAALGPGMHWGEWWGVGIQRGYGLSEKRFSLFNTARWNAETLPVGLHAVPVLYQGPNDETEILNALHGLELNGSKAAPGFSKPEGVVIFHSASQTLFKKTIDRDEAPKGQPR